MIPKPGEVVYVDRRASVQFSGDRALIFRVTAVPGWPTYDGWVWLRGYVLTPSGAAVAQREIFVQVEGLRRIPPKRSVAGPSATRSSAIGSGVAGAAAPPRPNRTPPAAYRPAADRRTPGRRFRV